MMDEHSRVLRTMLDNVALVASAKFVGADTAWKGSDEVCFWFDEAGDILPLDIGHDPYNYRGPRA